MTHETLTPSFFATSLALTSWRIGRLSIAITGKKFPWSLPFNRSMLPSFTFAHCTYFVSTARTKLCQMNTPDDLGKAHADVA